MEETMWRARYSKGSGGLSAVLSELARFVRLPD